MRRSDFVKLLGVSEEAFDMARARKHLPLRGRAMKRGWQEFSVDDALAFEAAMAFGRVGVRRADAREVVDTYFDEAIVRAFEASGQSIFLGVVKAYAVNNGTPVVQDQFPILGTMSDLAAEVQRLTDDLGIGPFYDGLVAINLNLCLSVISDRAARAGIHDARLSELAALLGGASEGTSAPQLPAGPR